MFVENFCTYILFPHPFAKARTDGEPKSFSGGRRRFYGWAACPKIYAGGGTIDVGTGDLCGLSAARRMDL
jgi:hypothetical protein